MTKKDYVAIARVLNDERQQYSGGKLSNDAAQHVALCIGYVAQRLANVMARDNPRFNRARFLAACGVQS